MIYKTKKIKLRSLPLIVMCLQFFSYPGLSQMQSFQNHQIKTSSPHQKIVGIIGDSVATGAVSGNLNATGTSLVWNFLTRGIVSPKQTEFGVNFKENVFSNIISDFLGAINIINVSKNGSRVHSLYDQFSQIVGKAGQLPDYIFISFTANDACGMGVFEIDSEGFKRNYTYKILNGKSGEGGLSKMISEMTASKPIKIYFIASLNFNQVLTNSSILNQPVNLGGGKSTTCLNFRKGHQTHDETNWLIRKLPQMCRAILETDPLSQDPDDVKRREHLENVYQAMIESQQEVIRQAKIMAPSNVSLHYLESPVHLEFQGEHIANDCFHLSRRGQDFLGLSLWEEIYLSNTLFD